MRTPDITLSPPSQTTIPTTPIPTPKPIAPTKRRTTKDTRPAAEVPADLGKLIQRDVKLVEELGWEEFVKRRRGRGDLTEMIGVEHPARRILRRYAMKGVPVKMHTKDWDTKNWSKL